MKKIPTLFVRDFNNDPSRVLPEYHSDCLWVRDGEGWPTRKLDGMCCALVNGVFVKRREVRAGKPVPLDFIPSTEDDVTGKRVGWVPIGHGPEDRYFVEAMERFTPTGRDETFELVGPKSQGGVEGWALHALVPHGSEGLKFDEVPRDFNGLRGWLADKPIEGVVWHHPDGRMAKIKGRDFGHKRAAQRAAGDT